MAPRPGNKTPVFVYGGLASRPAVLSHLGYFHLFHVEQSLTDADAGLIVGRLIGKKGRKQP